MLKWCNLVGREGDSLGSWNPEFSFFLPVRFRSGNKLVQRHRINKDDDSWHIYDNTIDREEL